jgi:ferredoxin
VSETITQQALRALVDEWIAAGTKVAGPSFVKKDFCQYVPITASADLLLDGFIHPRNSIKEFFFPRHEKLYTYALKGQEVELADVAPPSTPQVILAARPCDTAAVAILDAVFNWGDKDEFYTRRRDASTIVTLACVEHDSQCFCTSVGLGPDAEKGADAMLLPMDGGFEVRCITDKGTALFAGRTQSSDKTAVIPEGPKVKMSPEQVRKALEDYENPLWKTATLRCLSCGACSFTCPTCHCFDIVDEGTSHGGCRAKNWDSCQLCMFTKHASGHNPRNVQGQRQRQRTQHKFRIYPDKFGEVLCTGCGNCARNCPVSLGVLGTLLELCAQAPTTAGENK